MKFGKKMWSYIGVALVLVIIVLVYSFSDKKVPVQQSTETTQVESEVVVVSPETMTLYETCIQNNPADNYKRVTCLLPYFEELTMTFGANVALEKAKEMKESGMLNDCHLPAHVIGATNLKKFDHDLGKAFSACPLGCFEGCYHGAFEEYAEYTGKIEDLVTAGPIPEICTTVGDDRKETLHCVHGIGHGLMRHMSKDQMTSKIDVCNRITDLDYRTGCISGVIMENMNTHLELSETDLKAALPNICDPIANNPTYQDLEWLCIEEISDGLMQYTGGDRAKSSEFCEVLPEETKTQCLEGIVGFRDTDAEIPHSDGE